MIAFDEIAGLVQEHCGFAPAPALLTALRRVVTHRCVEKGGITMDDYLALLRVSPEELSSLTHELIIPETFFFRYPESFLALLAWAKEHRRPLRILSAACSTGEEAYTIAMTLLMDGFATTDFVIEGWDLNPASVATAREGYYSLNSFRSGAMGWRDQFFVRKGAGWHARSALRDAVHFKTANLLDITAHDAWDVIFCRNALIYFSPDQQRKVVHRLDRALVAGGILFLGPAEPPLFQEHNWISAKYSMSFACVRKNAADSLAEAARPSAPKPRPVISVKAPRSASATRPATRPTTPPISSSTKPSLEQAQIFADEGKLDDAQVILTEILRRESGYVEANFLMGVVEEARGHKSAAESCYRRVLFLMPSHLEALQHMKLLMRIQGREQAAERLGQRAARYHTSHDS